MKYNKKIFNTFTRIKISLFAIKFFVPILGFLNKSEVPERQNCPQKLKHSGYFFLFSYFQDKILRKFDRFSFWERFVQILKSIFRKFYLRTLLFHRVSKLLGNTNRFWFVQAPLNLTPILKFKILFMYIFAIAILVIAWSP